MELTPVVVLLVLAVVLMFCIIALLFSVTRHAGDDDPDHPQWIQRMVFIRDVIGNILIILAALLGLVAVIALGYTLIGQI